jgi:predicted HicB family RNase H-like nuclease
MTMVRVGESAHRVLKEIAARRGVSMQTVVEDAIERYRRQEFLEQLNDDFSALRQRPVDWRDELAERAAWEQTVGDDPEDE